MLLHADTVAVNMHNKLDSSYMRVCLQIDLLSKVRAIIQCSLTLNASTPKVHKFRFVIHSQWMDFVSSLKNMYNMSTHTWTHCYYSIIIMSFVKKKKATG